MLNRREWLGMLGATAALPPLAWADHRVAFEGTRPPAVDARADGLIEEILCGAQPAMPPDALYARDPEAYWAELRKQWIFRPGFLYLNNGTNGS